ncbi:hypothetical protein ABZ729_09590 [Streptomyces sp. NPDC006678]|uniref:hypothetical protein n=1 Tax=Streptomyces sp. NPDC006678 TaxID=3157185 RepID=UPI0033F7D876
MVLVHPEYCHRSGSWPASRLGIRPGHDAPGKAVKALVPDGSPVFPQGTIIYPEAFGV